MLWLGLLEADVHLATKGGVGRVLKSAALEPKWVKLVARDPTGRRAWNAWRYASPVNPSAHTVHAPFSPRRYTRLAVPKKRALLSVGEQSAAIRLKAFQSVV